MILIYAYIHRFKNYVDQEITLDSAYDVKFCDGQLSISYRGPSHVRSILRGDKKPDALHLLVGKTGSGKTNLLQLIGAKSETRMERKWNGEDDSYFLLYAMGNSEFFLEICDVVIRQFPAGREKNDPTMPEHIKQASARMRTVRTVRFRTGGPMEEGKDYLDFIAVPEYGWDITPPEITASDRGMIINRYDIGAFITPPYPDDREDNQDFRGDWLGRMAIPYHRTSLWRVCDYIREYIQDVEHGETKKQVSLVLSTHNFADAYPLELPNEIKREYWTFYEKKRKEQEAEIGTDSKKKKVKPKNAVELTNKQMFIHDLWTDYARYLRKWIEKIHSFIANDEIPVDRLDESGEVDVYQETIDHYTAKEYHDGFDPSELPDGYKMSIVKRCIWLAEYIDRLDGGDPHGILWQAIDDIKDIGKILESLDEKYFTLDTCTIPVVDMALPRYQRKFYDLFERMEAYHPDNAGIFTENLLPYRFTHLSTGEYQYAKVLGGLEDDLGRRFEGDALVKRDKIILLDEPEAYMHPELARKFFSKLYEVTTKYQDAATVQIILATHSPFLLSDVLAEEVTRLDIDPDTGNAVVRDGSCKEYFGANIHTILSDSFFLDYTIGEYSRAFLQNAYDRLKQYAAADEIDGDGTAFIHSMRELVPHIGDRLIRDVFQDLLDRFPQ